MKLVIALIISICHFHIVIGSGDCWLSVDSANTATVRCVGIDSSNVNILLDTLNEALLVTAENPLNVDIQESEIIDLPPDTLAGYPIRSLVLQNNRITSIPTSFLANVDRTLLILDLSQNNIIDISYNDFNELPFATSLQILLLAQNQIQKLLPGLFSPLINLQKLRLQFNLIDYIEDDTFSELDELTELHLYANLIAGVSVGAFGVLPKLRVLFLNQNNISTLENGTFDDERFPALSKIFLGNNPFYCDCNLQWFKSWLDYRRLNRGSDPTCVYPSFNSFEFVEFCPSISKSQKAVEEYKQAYFAYVIGQIMMDSRERSYRLTKLENDLLSASQKVNSNSF